MCMPSRSRSDCGFMSYLAGVLSADCVAGAVADCCGWFTPAKAGTVSRDKATSERSRFFIVNLLWQISSVQNQDFAIRAVRSRTMATKSACLLAVSARPRLLLLCGLDAGKMKCHHRKCEFRW